MATIAWRDGFRRWLTWGVNGWTIMALVACFPELPPDALDGDTETADAGDTAAIDTATGLSSPTGVAASDDLPGEVEVRWQVAFGAIGYHVERCVLEDCAPESGWTRLTPAPIEETNYQDLDTAPAESVPAPQGVSATVDRPWDVGLKWDAVTAPAAPHYHYRVVAVHAAGESEPSVTTVGHRAERPVTGYEVRVDEGLWQEVAGGLQTEWADTDAIDPAVRPGQASASSGTYAEFVRLTVTGSDTILGASHAYQVRAVTRYGPAESSPAVSGRRAAGGLTYQWERSATTEPDGFASLPGATGPSFDDAGAPADGSVRWYRVAVSAEGAADAISEPAAGARQPPPGVPGGVTASSDLEAHVHVTWQPVAGALGYHIYREDVRLTSAGPITATNYQDVGAAAPATTWQAPSDVVATTNDSTQVVVTWTAPPRPLGAVANYRVRAVSPAGDGPLSAEASGRRAAPSLIGFEVEVNPSGGGASWFATGETIPEWTHNDPPMATISEGTITATQGDHRAHVRLTSSGWELAEAPKVFYRVRGRLQGGASTPSSVAVVGHRSVGDLAMEWSRSAGVEPVGFTPLLDATGVSFDDTTAPSDGASRWYRLSLTAPGAETRILGPKEGWRAAFVAVVGAFGHTCSLERRGGVWCWGANENGQLGRNSTSAEPLGPAPVPGLSGVVELAAWGATTCALAGNGEVQCWGGGPVGDGTNFSRFEPTPVASGVASLGVGCLVMENGRLRCWGEIPGNGDGDSVLPVDVRTVNDALLGQVEQVSNGGGHKCARQSSGLVWCWGSNLCGELGVAGAGCEDDFCFTAVHASLVSNSFMVSVGYGHSCSISSDAEIACWGCAAQGALGDGGASSGGPAPVAVGGVAGAVAISASSSSTCALTGSGTVVCWGSNTHGQLGSAGGGFSSTPVEVGSGVVAATGLGSGFEFYCAIQSGDVWCWGRNSSGQLGPGVTGPSSNVPVKVAFP